MSDGIFFMIKHTPLPNRNHPISSPICPMGVADTLELSYGCLKSLISLIFGFRSPVPHPFHQVPSSAPLRIHELPNVNPFKGYGGYPTYPPTPTPSYPTSPSPSPYYIGSKFGSFATPTPFATPRSTIGAPVAPAAHPVVPFRNPKSLFQNHFSYNLPRA